MTGKKGKGVLQICLFFLYPQKYTAKGIATLTSCFLSYAQNHAARSIIPLFHGEPVCNTLSFQPPRTNRNNSGNSMVHEYSVMILIIPLLTAPLFLIYFFYGDTDFSPAPQKKI
jgi:hypothetical protein